MAERFVIGRVKHYVIGQRVVVTIVAQGNAIGTEVTYASGIAAHVVGQPGRVIYKVPVAFRHLIATHLTFDYFDIFTSFHGTTFHCVVFHVKRCCLTLVPGERIERSCNHSG